MSKQWIEDDRGIQYWQQIGQYEAECKRFIFEWREQNKERLRANGKEYAARPEVRAITAVRNATWRQQNKDKIAVHYIFHRAMKTGLIKPQPCWVCGEKAEAHHPDYSAPLDVVWLCKSHHKQAHALIPAQGQANENW